MSDEPLLRAIRENLDDDAPRLVYADVLSERGDPRGELIVVQCALASSATPRGEYAALRRRERELLSKHGRAWTRIYGHRTIPSDFERGFVERPQLDLPELKAHWPQLKQLPLRDLVLYPYEEPPRIGHLAFFAREPSSSPTISLERHAISRTSFDREALRTLFDDGDPDLDALVWEHELPHPRLFPALHEVEGEDFDASMFALLANEGSALERLIVHRTLGVTADHVADFTTSKTFRRLETCMLTVDEAGALAVLRAPETPALRRLNLIRQGGPLPFGPRVSEALAMAPFIGQLTWLIGGFMLDARLIEAMTRMPALERLALTKNQPPGAIDALVASPMPARLRRLSLAGHDYESASSIARASYESLAELSLRSFTISLEDARALPSVRSLSLAACRYGDGARAVLLERWPELVTSADFRRGR